MAMLRNMATSLVVHERIRTTDAKAKELRRIAEKVITLGKRGDLHARRQAAAVLKGKEATRKVFGQLADRYKDVPGGYTRIIKLGPRHGDGAMLSMIELVQPGSKGPGPKKKVSRKGRTPAKSADRAGRGSTTKAPAAEGSPQGS